MISTKHSLPLFLTHLIRKNNTEHDVTGNKQRILYNQEYLKKASWTPCCVTVLFQHTPLRKHLNNYICREHCNPISRLKSQHILWKAPIPSKLSKNMDELMVNKGKQFKVFSNLLPKLLPKISSVVKLHKSSIPIKS